jgi:hypothetical protein
MIKVLGGMDCCQRSIMRVLYILAAGCASLCALCGDVFAV